MPERVFLRKTRFFLIRFFEKNAFFSKKRAKKQEHPDFDDGFRIRSSNIFDNRQNSFFKNTFFEDVYDKSLKIRLRRSIQRFEIYKTPKTASKTASKRESYGRLKSTPPKFVKIRKISTKNPRFSKKTRFFEKNAFFSKRQKNAFFSKFRTRSGIYEKT